MIVDTVSAPLLCRSQVTRTEYTHRDDVGHLKKLGGKTKPNDGRNQKMKQYSLTIATLVILLTGCMSYPTAREGDNESLRAKDEGIRPFSRIWYIRNNPFMAALARPLRLFPIVYVEDSQVIVDQEPIHVKPDEGQAQRVKIEWSIGESGYFFPDDDSVVIRVESGPAPVNPTCFRQGPSPATTFICHYKRPRGKSKYSYTIKVSDGTRTYLSDPYIAND
jgi:hypothetical protein